MSAHPRPLGHDGGEAGAQFWRYAPTVMPCGVPRSPLLWEELPAATDARHRQAAASVPDAAHQSSGRHAIFGDGTSLRYGDVEKFGGGALVHSDLAGVLRVGGRIAGQHPGGSHLVAS